MIEGKWRYKGESEWHYCEARSEEDFLKVLEDDPKEVEDYQSRPKQVQDNPIKKWFGNLRNVKKNWGKVRGSPYASLVFALKARQIIIWPLIIFIAWRIYDMVANFRGSGAMAVVTKLFMIGIGIFICWKIYSTIPQAKKQIEYYRKYPHTINYVPTNVKEDVNDIFNKIRENKEKQKGGKK